MKITPATGAVVAILLSLVCLLGSVINGHTAKSKLPVDLTAEKKDVSLDVFKVSDLLVRNYESTVILDIRNPVEYQQYHIRNSINISDGNRQAIEKAISGNLYCIVISSSEKKGNEFISKFSPVFKNCQFHTLKDGIGSWYMTYKLPVKIFSTKPAPYGYDQAISTVKNFFEKDGKTDRKPVLESIATLARLNFTPDQLGNSRKKAPSGPRKKISGGCE